MHFTGKISPKPLLGFGLKSFSVTVILTSLFTFRLFAQFSDTFSDGNFDENPPWQGDAANFIVNPDGQLQLNSSEAGSSWLSTAFATSTAEVVEWKFFVKQSFAPSGANFGRVYLMSDQPDLSGPLNGYYLQLGEAGSADAVELFRQSGDASQSVCRATAGSISSAFEIGIKVTRTARRWEVYVDYGGGTRYVLEATGVDDMHGQSSFFGVACTHTVTNGARFFFDDFGFRKTVPPDTIPPLIASLSCASPALLHVAFSEEVERSSAEDPLHYLLLPGRIYPATAILQGDGSTVALTFEQAFQNGYELGLLAEGVADHAGNVMAATEKKILYFVPSPVVPGDVVITEIFPDPAPQVKLPDSEFVEIFNRSANPVQLGGWAFTDGTSVGMLPERILLPGHYLVICASADVTVYDRLGPALACSNFPTLNNDGDRLILSNGDGKVIDSVRYNVTWYKDEDKAAGGWSLERIDPADFCDEERNWLASEDPAGGTPGNQNSVYATMPDQTGPKLCSAIPLASNSLLVRFNEKLDAVVAPPDAFVITPLLPIEGVSFFDASRKTLLVTLTEPIQGGVDYALEVNAIYDCAGNRLQQDFSYCTFVMPEQATAGDIVVNEILFNPTTTGTDFVEIFNRSRKTINLLNWSIRNAGTGAGKNRTIVAQENLLIRPNAYKVFTEDGLVLSGEYLSTDIGSIWETDLPPFNDDAGSVALFDDSGLLIDSMRYSAEMHSPFLKEAEGVSLERISAEASGTIAANWYSASETAGYATPGYANSSLRPGNPAGPESIVIEPEILQHAVATADFARIKFHFGRTGLIANVKIFDSRGRVVRNVAQNALLGSEGFLRWDGDNDDGAPAGVGYYLVWFEVFDADGFVETHRKRIAIY